MVYVQATTLGELAKGHRGRLYAAFQLPVHQEGIPRSNLPYQVTIQVFSKSLHCRRFLTLNDHAKALRPMIQAAFDTGGLDAESELFATLEIAGAGHVTMGQAAGEVILLEAMEAAAHATPTFASIRGESRPRASSIAES